LDRAVLETSSDRYVIVEYIAEGGMGAIYLGKKIGVGGFEKEVVLKQLLPEFTREPKFIDLFLREARLSASLDHANIVRTVDLVTAGEDYFIVMEYVRGGDLRTLMKRAKRRHERFPPQAGIFIAHEILEALTYAHTRVGPDGRPLGLIHRDVSPSNILLSGAGEVKLTDFGIAKASTHRSVFFKVKGKVGYMSPEQARGEPIDARSDIFSLAVVLYEVLVGERLFVGDLMSTAAVIYSQPIAAPSQRRTDLPEELDAVLMKALSLDRHGRFQTAEEFQDALSRVAAKKRLLCGASEMSSILKNVCGEEPSQWLRMESLPAEETHGTAILTGGGTNKTGALDDEFDDDDEPSGRSAPRPLPKKKEFTSVIAIAKPKPEQQSDDMFDGESKRTTFVRESSRPESPQFPEPRKPTKPRERVPSDAFTFVRENGRSSPPAQVEESRTRPLPETRRDPHDADTSLPMLPPPQTMPFSPQVQPIRPDSTDSVKKNRPPRIWPVLLVLLLIGVGVALGVAFSGPELEVVDPQLPVVSPQPAR
jgi:serine/threonine protein kinase